MSILTTQFRRSLKTAVTIIYIVSALVMYFASSIRLGPLYGRKGVARLSCDYGRKTIWAVPDLKHTREKITSIIFSHLTEIISSW